jgi:opacity protein-like surface antigen
MKIAFLLSATSASLLVATAAHAQFSWSNVYATAAVSYVDLQREAPTNPLITRDSKNDVGVGLGIGYQFHPKLGIEIARHDLGTARLTDAGPGGPNYSDQAARATVLAVKFTPWTEKTFMPFVKLGAARMAVSVEDTAGLTLRSAPDRTYAALGVDYRVMPKVKMGLMYEHYWPTADEATPAGAPPRLKPRALSLVTSVSF